MGQDHETEVLKRYSFTLPPKLIEVIDDFAVKLEKNRSMVVREALSHWTDHKSQEIELSGEGVSIISYIYNHHDTRVSSDLMSIQHLQEELISSTTHVHINHHNCYEVTICKGDLQQIKQLATKLSSIKGIHAFNSTFTHAE